MYILPKFLKNSSKHSEFLIYLIPVSSVLHITRVSYFIDALFDLLFLCSFATTPASLTGSRSLYLIESIWLWWKSQTFSLVPKAFYPIKSMTFALRYPNLFTSFNKGLDGHVFDE